jgi:hypothetical protein
MSNITTSELNQLKEKASRRLSFRMSQPKETSSANVSTQGTKSAQNLSEQQSVVSNSTVEIMEEQINNYRGAAYAYKESQKSLFSKDIPRTRLGSMNFSFPTTYDFESNKFKFKASTQSNTAQDEKYSIDSSISGIRKSIKKLKSQNKLKKKSSRATKKSKKGAEKSPSILDKVFNFPSYSKANDQFASLMSLKARSRTLNSNSNANISQLAKHHTQYATLRNENSELDTMTQEGEESVANQPFNF